MMPKYNLVDEESIGSDNSEEEVEEKKRTKRTKNLSFLVLLGLIFLTIVHDHSSFRAFWGYESLQRVEHFDDNFEDGVYCTINTVEIVFEDDVADYATSVPSFVPSSDPSSSPTMEPSSPTLNPTLSHFPSCSPSSAPTNLPSLKPTSPTNLPTMSHAPSSQPSSSPSCYPTVEPSAPTSTPTLSHIPTSTPLASPTSCPSQAPSSPSTSPTISQLPSSLPSMTPSSCPSTEPSSQTYVPTLSFDPSTFPSVIPSVFPTVGPSSPSLAPTLSSAPSTIPSVSPTYEETLVPSSPSQCPTHTCLPSHAPSIQSSDSSDFLKVSQISPDTFSAVPDVTYETHATHSYDRRNLFQQNNNIESTKFKEMPIRASLFPPVKQIYFPPEETDGLALLSLASVLKFYLKGIHRTSKPELYRLVRGEIGRFCETSATRAWSTTANKSRVASVEEVTLSLLVKNNYEGVNSTEPASENVSHHLWNGDCLRNMMMNYRNISLEGYCLHVHLSKVEICAYTVEGIMHGLNTLAQLTTAPRLLHLPVIILDWPSNSWRGITTLAWLLW